MIQLCKLCFEYDKTTTNKRSTNNIEIVEKHQCNGLHHKKLIDSFKT